jgi:hypothetical protein
MNEKSLRDGIRDIEIHKIKLRQARQKECLHRQSEPTADSPKRAFHCLKLPTGEIVGVCPYCLKLISNIDPADKYYFENIAYFEKMPESGQFLDHLPNGEKLIRQLARQTPEEKDRILAEIFNFLKPAKKEPEKTKTSYTDFGLKGYTTEELYEMPMEQLEALLFKKNN